MKIIDKNGKLELTDYNELEVYAIACKIENEGVEFYKQLSKNSKNVQTKEMLELLMQEEQRHCELLGERFNYLKKVKNKASEEVELLNKLEYGVFQPFKSIKNLDTLLSDKKRTLEMALIIEDKILDFYEKCRKKLISVLSEIELDSIINVEKKHKMFFMDMINSIND
ncbi:MAG: ferritin family protein [Candidatus Omnitrophota bacterium]